MKIGILTYRDVHNHGAVLQANALKTVLESWGHEVCFLQFQRNYDLIPSNSAKKYKLGLSSIPFYIKYMLQRGISNVVYNFYKNRILNKYRNNSLKLGPRYSDFQGDVVIIGSDEVFSFEVGINPFFFGHGVQCNRILSYAGCFGPTTLSFLKDHSLEALVTSGLEQMSAVGVRDKNSKDIVESVSSKKAQLVCDPVILYGYEKEKAEFKPKQQKYLVVYSYDKNMNDTTEVQAIRNYAKKNNLKVLSVGYYHKWCDKNISVSPDELLGYIQNAELVVTDTFHGAVLSLVCNTNFAVKLRGNSNKLKNLLEEYSLTDRLIEDFSDLEKISSQSIDFDSVNNIIEKRRNFSEEFLKTSLERN